MSAPDGTDPHVAPTAARARQVPRASHARAAGPLLEVEDLVVTVERRHRGSFRAVDTVSFSLEPGAAFGVVGESGSGKSLLLRALAAVLPEAARVSGGRVRLAGEELPPSGRAARRSRRGRMALVFQDPLAALDPVHAVGWQIAEVPRRVLHLPAAESRRRAVELLGLVGIPDPARRADAYPHQLSGGMRQRVAIAMALASEPEVLLCDEPTTALDVTVQAQILELLDDLRRRLALAVVLVSHDLAVVRELCGEVAVMYSGRVVERGPTGLLVEDPRHAYTRGLLDAVLDLDDAGHVPRPIGGSIPDPMRLPPGCSFHPRCALTTAACIESVPELVEVASSPVPAGDGTLAGARETARDAPGAPGASARRFSACIWHERVASMGLSQSGPRSGPRETA